MDVLTNVTGLMAAQYTVARVKQVAKFHICSRFDLSSTTKSGSGWDCGFRNAQMVCSMCRVRFALVICIDFSDSY